MTVLISRLASPADFKGAVLRGRDVDLRPFTASDVSEKYQGWLLDEETVRFLDVRFADRSLPSLQRWVDGVHADPNRLFFMIVDRASGEEIGTANLQIDPVHGYGNYGYLIGAKAWWGTGIALQVQVILFDFAFGTLGVRRFYGGARRDNVMSQFNLRRLGFQKEGVFRKHVRISADSEEYSDAIYYGLQAEEWAATSGRFDELRYQNDAQRQPSPVP